MIIAGIDEAGRGPVIGPLVIAIAAVEKGELFKLHALGIKDSKLLTPKKRLELYRHIKKLTKSKIIVLSNHTIDSALKNPKSNLNWLEADHAAKLINSVKPDKVILDCPSNNLKDYKNYMQKKLKVETEIKVEHKADLRHVIVGAASILAKVTRDKEIQKLKDHYNVEFGSGYPSDPLTQVFLKHNYNKYDFFRKTWESYQRVLKEKSQKRLGEF